MSRVREAKQITGAHTASPAGISKCTLSNATSKVVGHVVTLIWHFTAMNVGQGTRAASQKEHKKHEIKRIMHGYLTGLLKNLSRIWPQRHRSTITDIQTAVEDAAATGRMQLPQAVGVPKVSQNISRDAAAKSCCRPSESDLWSTAKTTGPASGFSWGLRCRCWAKTQQRLICCGADNLLMLIEPRTDHLSSAQPDSRSTAVPLHGCRSIIELQQHLLRK